MRRAVKAHVSFQRVRILVGLEALGTRVVLFSCKHTTNMTQLSSNMSPNKRAPAGKLCLCAGLARNLKRSR